MMVQSRENVYRNNHGPDIDTVSTSTAMETAGRFPSLPNPAARSASSIV